ncbi:hypothetical protein Stok01_01433 [Sulfurisphaera tokodaii]
MSLTSDEKTLCKIVYKVNFIYISSDFFHVTEVIRVSKDVKDKLVKIAAELQLSKGKKVSLNEAIGYLITFYEENKRSKKDSQLLISLLGSAKGIREEFERSRIEDESSS